jgi:hypothetical protein
MYEKMHLLKFKIKIQEFDILPRSEIFVGKILYFASLSKIVFFILAFWVNCFPIHPVLASRELILNALIFWPSACQGWVSLL